MTFKHFLPDLKSGVVVFLVALPLCLGVAMACNAPLLSGILTGVIGGTLVALLSGSLLSVSGPSAGLTAIILSSVAVLGSYEAFAAALMIAGILQLVLGLAKAGGIANFIPVAVIKGTLAGIGIILIIKQMPHLVGYDRDPEGDFDFDQPDGHNSFSELFYMIRYVTPGVVIIGLSSILILVLTSGRFYTKHKLLSMLPGPLLAVLAGVGLNVAFSQSEALRLEANDLVSLPQFSNLHELKGLLLNPDFSQVLAPKFWGVVITVAIVASLESLLSIAATDKLDPLRRDSDPSRELVAQGFGNMLCGVLGALPVTAVIVRSSANIQAGAKSKLSALIHALLLAACILCMPGLLRMIPNASLAAILIYTGYKLAKVSLFTEQFRKGLDQFLPFVITIAVMLISDLLKGVCAGLIVSIVFIIRANVKSSFDTAMDLIEGRRHYMIRLPQHITFFNKGFMIGYFREIPNGSEVIIDGSINKTTDKDALEVLRDFAENSVSKKIDIKFVKYTL